MLISLIIFVLGGVMIYWMVQKTNVYAPGDNGYPVIENPQNNIPNRPIPEKGKDKG